MGILIEDKRKKNNFDKRVKEQKSDAADYKEWNYSEDDEDDAHELEDPDKGASVNDVENGRDLRQAENTLPSEIKFSSSKIRYDWDVNSHITSRLCWVRWYTQIDSRIYWWRW